MRRLLLPACLLLSTCALAGPDQRTTVGDGGLGDLLGMIDSEQPERDACRQSGLAQELGAQERALGSVDAMGCKAIDGHLGSLGALSGRAAECRDAAMQQRIASLSARYRAVAGQRCQGSGEDAAGQVAGIAELGLSRLQQRADDKAARQQAQLQQQRLTEQARQAALARQREIAARAVTTTSVNPYSSSTTSSTPVISNGGSGVQAPPAPVSNASGGNTRPGFTYDDTNHSNCLTIQASRANTGHALAYGHYQLTNRCNYPITAHICTVSDNADGSPSDSWNRFQDGAPCPGGWGGASFKAGETQESRTWFEFRHIQFRAYICREGWSIVNTQDKPIYLIGERYRCRIYR